MANSFETSETGNWNVAENWSNLMIFKPFQEASLYLTMAKNGCSNIEEDFMFDDETKTKTRIQSIKWARDKIEEGIRQSLFAVKSGDVDNVKNKLHEVLSLDMPLANGKSPIDMIEIKMINRDKVIKAINEDAFKIVYGILKRVYMEVLIPLNRSDLIFMYREQFDPAEFKDKIKERFIDGD